MSAQLTDEQLEEVERLLSYYDCHGPVHNWGGDAAKLLRDLLPDWSAFKEPEPICQNCGQRIRFNGFTWDHPDQGNHTVCDWREGMEPTDRVATPA